MKNFSTIINDKDIITVEYQKNNSVLFSESQTLTDAQKSQARSNIGAGTSNFDGTWGSLSGKPNVIQSTGNSTSDVMSQKAVTDELNEKANSADLATVATSGSYNDLSNKPAIPTDYVTIDTEQEITGKKTVIPPANKDNSNQIATTAWAGRRYKSIADFGFTSQTTVKAIVQKIIDNGYGYCTFACTNDNFNNFSDTPDGYGTLIIEVGSNALRPLISFTKQAGASNNYKHWQANIVRGANNQVTEIQWYEMALKTDIPDISGKANLSGGNTFSGNQVITDYLDIRGTAAEKHLKTRGIGGSDGNGTSSDLYLQYSSDYKTYFGKTGQSSLNADGSISINSKTAATTDQIKAQVAYGTCATAAATAAKVVTVSDTTWALTPGTIVGVKFTNTNTASNVTINVNGTGAKSIWYNNAKQTSNSNLYAGYANRLIYYMYDGTYWCWLNAGAENDTIPSAMSWTGASTAAKTATCHNYSLLAKSYLQVIMISSNTAQSALTLNINGKGAKPIYINGAESSATNYTLPAGSYFVYYDGTNYYFRTDGNLTVRGSIAMTKADFSLSGTTLTITLP